MSKKLSEKLWWRNLAFAGAAIAMLPVSLLAQGADDEELEELEAFTMIGSRISRVDSAPISPVLQVTSESLEKTGYSTVGDALRSLPMNTGGAHVPDDSGNSFTPGLSSMNLRGLGGGNTLVLMNGRRGAPYAAPSGGFVSVFDLNSIPRAAIQSIDIEKDGASALYGSDAVAGVVNVQLKTDYEGLSTTLEIGNYLDTDGFYRSASMVYGTSNAKDSILFAASYSRQESVYSRDLDYTKDADHRDLNIDAYFDFYDPDNPDDGYIANNKAADAGYSVEALNTYLDSALGGINSLFDKRSSLGTPGIVWLNPGATFNGDPIQGIPRGGYYYTFEGPTSDFSSATPVAGLNKYNFMQDSVLFPEKENYSFYAHVKHNITDYLYSFGEISFSRNQQVIDSAPAPAALGSDNGRTAQEKLYLPAANPYNPFGVDLDDGYLRLKSSGNRSNSVTADSPRYLAGLGGTLGGDWTWESAIMHSASEVTTEYTGALGPRLQEALLGLTRATDGTLSFDESTPLGDRVYYNWFGDNAEDISNYLTGVNTTTGEYIIESADFNVSGSIFELPAGKVGLSIGGEYREESMDNHKTYLNEQGLFIGGGHGTSSHGGRNITSMYAETIIPATTWMELQLAGRWESYSDQGYGSTVKPKVGLKIKATDWLAFRASFGESFKAPDLYYLYTASTNSFTSSPVLDPISGEDKQIQIVTGGNPDLKPETTDSYYAGFVIEPTSGLFKGLVVSLDYVRMEQENLLLQLSDVYDWTDFLSGAANGDPTFAGKVVRNNNGQLLYVRDDYSNIGEAVYSGFDGQVAYTYDTDNYGTFYSSVSVTYTDEVSQSGRKFAGHDGYPKWKGVFDFNWQKSDWTASVHVNYVGKQDHVYASKQYALDASDGFDGMIARLYYDVDDQFVVNPSISYTGFENNTITLGVNNVFNSDPPLAASDTLGYFAGVNYGKPFYWYLRWTRDF